MAGNPEQPGSKDITKTFDLTTLGLTGSHTITVKARANGYMDSEPSNAVSYGVAGDTVQVSGTWYFNEQLTSYRDYGGISEYPNQAISFTSGGILCTGMSDYEGGDYLRYDTNETTNGFLVYAHGSEGWASGFRTITFKDVQTVSKVFYDWLTANAEYLGTYTVSGTWVFNESDPTSGPPGVMEHVNFTSNGQQYIYIGFANAGETLLYEPTSGHSVYVWTYSSGNGWENEVYRTITFDGTQTVSKDFYEWLCANTDSPFTTNIPKIEIEVNESNVFRGTSQVILSGGTGRYTVSDSAITAIGATTSLVGNIYTINWDLKYHTDNGAYIIYFSDGVTTIPFQIKVDGLLCLTGDMLITLSDGTQKRIDQITLNDKVLAINPETGELCEDIITFTDSDSVKKHYHYHKFTFEDGTVIKTVHRHRFYNIEEQQMSHLDLFYVGDHVVKQDGTTTRLISGEIIEEEVQHYTIFTRYQNYFVNGILSGNRFTPYMSLGVIPSQEPEIEGQGVPVFNEGADISLLYGSP